MQTNRHPSELPSHPDVTKRRHCDGGGWVLHLVWNDDEQVTVSLHTHGRHFNDSGRSSFNPEINAAMPFIVGV